MRLLKPNVSCAKINGNEAIKIVFAGVGSPMNEEVCRVSTLNFANRNAENIVIRNAINSIPWGKIIPWNVYAPACPSRLFIK